MISRVLPVLAVAAQRIVLPRVEDAAQRHADRLDRQPAPRVVPSQGPRRAAPPCPPRPAPRRMTEQEVWERYDMLMVSLMLPPMMN